MVSIPVKDKRYQLEIRRAIKRNAKTMNMTIYFNGPYLYSYSRDGQYIKGDYIGKKEDWRRKKVPRKVQAAALPFTTESVVRERVHKIESEYSSGERTLG
ncbi:hypothetical protein P8935_23985 [Telmatobacter sp. DSM 110680]|uniref:Integrase DNA-binding domain-containing protein n=1 Tax=Telmatobacter sp. DSM 110680 TaxID=3036704 RepID=A0AAU7DIE6_9BACT